MTRLTLSRFFLFGFLIIIVVAMALISPLVYLHLQKKHSTIQTSMSLFIRYFSL